jgi:cobalt-zinc-cadmium resistance protein CzcA
MPHAAGAEALKAVPGIVDLDLYRDVDAQLQVRFDRQALARAGVTMEDAQRTLETALAGRVATTMWEGERPVPVRLILPPAIRDDAEKVGAVTVASESGARVPLRDLAEIRVADGVASINREGNSRYLALKFNVEGRDMGSVVNDAIATVAQREAARGQYLVWGGEFGNGARSPASS